MTLTRQPDVRTAELADLRQVCDFGAEVLPGVYGPILGEQLAQQELEWWSPSLMEPAIAQSNVLVIDEGSRIVGVCEMGRWDDDVVVWKLYVRADKRGSGYGQMLLDAALRAVPSDESRVVLEHFAGNGGAARFYERNHFVVTSVEEHPSGDPAAATVWRARDLTAHTVT